MPTFNFRYESVLKQRQLVEDETQRDLAKVLRQRMIIQNQLRDMQDTITHSKRDLGDTLVGRVDLERVGHFARYSAQTTIRAHQIVGKLAQLEQQVTVMRDKLNEAMKARKAMELLRERDYAKWKLFHQRREANELDEMAAQSYIRKQMDEAAAMAEATA